MVCRREDWDNRYSEFWKTGTSKRTFNCIICVLGVKLKDIHQCAHYLVLTQFSHEHGV